MPEMLVLGPNEAETKRLVDLLHNAGYIVQHVNALDKALRRLDIDEPDGFFCFYHMNGCNAREVLQQVRLKRPHLPFVIICDFSESSHAAEIVADGADDFLPMPFDPTEVAACAGRILSAGNIAAECEQIRFEARDGVLIMHFPPEMPFEVSSNLNRMISSGLPVPERGVVLDLAETTYFSSSGVSTLFLIYRHFQALDGRIFITGCGPHIRNVLRLAGVTGFFQFSPTLSEALALLDSLDG